MTDTPSQKVLYPVGVENLFIAMMVDGQDTPDALPEYETTIYDFPVIETIGIAGSQTTTTKWASNKQFASITKNTQYTLTLDYPGMPVFIMDKLQGVLAKKGVAFDTSKPKEFPRFAVGFIAPLNDGNKIARWYPRVQVTPPEEEFTTITDEETEIKSQQLVMTATPLLFNGVTKADFNTSREGATGITAEDFMKQVVRDESELDTLFPEAPSGE